MAIEWRPLIDVVSEIIDRRGVTPIKLGGNFTNVGHRVISAKVIKDGLVDLNADEARYVDADVYKRWMKSPLRTDDVIMTSEAPLGELAYLKIDVDWVLGQRLFAIRPRAGSLNGQYLYYALKYSKVRDDLIARSSGTTVMGIRQAELWKVEIPVPCFKEQCAIAHILGTLDDKIELNRKQIETLEAMARTLFKAWFVDFEAVRAKMDGRWQRGQSLPGLTAHLYDLFPDRLVDSELGEIPEGWEIGRVSDFLSLAYGKSLPAGSRNPGVVPVYGSGGVTGYHDTSLLDVETVIVGRKGTVGSLYWEPLPCFPIDTVFYVQPLVPLPFCYHLLESLPLSDMNTDAAVPGLNRENVYRLEVVAPPQLLIKEFSDLARKFRDQIFRLHAETRILAQLRDTLLPKLLSGELRVLDPERIIGALI